MATKKAVAAANVSQFLAGFIDTTGAVAIPARFELVSAFKGARAPAAVGGKWGAIDTSGAWVFEPRFDLLKEFDANGHAIFRDGGLWGVVDAKGTVLMQPQATQLLATTGEAVLVKGGNGLQLIGYDGKLRLDGLMDFFPFSCQRAVAIVNGRAGVLDPACRWVVEPTYDAIYNYSEDLAAFERDGKAGWLDTNGKEVIPPAFEAAFDFVNGLARVRQGDLFGFADTNGKLVIPCTFRDVTNFDDGLAQARLPNGACVAIDTKGATVFESPLPWREAGFASKVDMEGFSSGRAVIRNDKGLYGFVDTKGNVSVEPTYNNVDNYAGSASAVTVSNDKFAIIDLEGKIIVSDLTRKPVFSEGLASIRMVNPEYEALQEAVELGAAFEKKITKFNEKLDAALDKAKPAVEKYAKAVMDSDLAKSGVLVLEIYDMNDFGITISTPDLGESLEVPGKNPLAPIAKVFEGGIMEEPKTRKGVNRVRDAYNAASDRWYVWLAERFIAAGPPKHPMYAHSEVGDAWIDLRAATWVKPEDAKTA